ncbi:hypothetical protein G6O69_19080 [Pseudenhygromyxa sp. WMMC2535]|uniref:hypothetical protein n=1 Tax=Pseudenhygromyxa sp. WMMC2535 TaxID=2712867 RepID=UPI0015521BAE|nr:hypothetical protein [Pseudenhygromyxa sp. WMMC2535]NVB39956.1 hypothetical protein [Pseudenhygromyxa sp. WMMC2535]
MHQEGDWWLRSGHPTYAPDKFFQVTAVEDPFENVYTTTYDAHALLTLSSTDPLGNTLTAAHDYRLLAPWQLTDPNGNRSQVAFDIRGFVIASAVMGKAGDSDGDTLEDPTATFEYDLFSWVTTGKPNWAKSRARETHQDPSTRWLEQRTYSSEDWIRVHLDGGRFVGFGGPKTFMNSWMFFLRGRCLRRRIDSAHAPRAQETRGTVRLL